MARKIKGKKFILFAIPLIAVVVAGLLFTNLGLTTVEVKVYDGVTAFVTRMYQVTLDRGPDPSGLASWTSGLRSGSLTGADVARNFIFSDEFSSKNLSNEQFLEVMYRAFFDRAPDPAGFNGWLSELNSGKGREYVLAGFVNSQEFQSLCAEYGINPGSLNGSRSSTTDIARSRSADMLSRGYFSHYTPEGTNIFNILKANGIGYRNAGENLAHSMPASAGSPEVFANAWMNSPTHAANILRPQYRSIGIGVAENNGRRVVTTVFTN